MAMATGIPELSFRAFFTYQEVTDFVESLAAARPDFCRLSSLGKSREGREIHLLTVTDCASGASEDKPGYLIHGNIHATELSGTHAALYTARQLLVDHDSSDLLKKVVFYIIPRLNPDGAEFVVTASGPVRSRTDRSQSEPNTLYPRDMNGDGLILSMRQGHRRIHRTRACLSAVKLTRRGRSTAFCPKVIYTSGMEPIIFLLTAEALTGTGTGLMTGALSRSNTAPGTSPSANQRCGT